MGLHFHYREALIALVLCTAVTEQLILDNSTTSNRPKDISLGDMVTYGDGSGPACRKIQIHHKSPDELLCSSGMTIYKLRLPDQKHRNSHISATALLSHSLVGEDLTSSTTEKELSTISSISNQTVLPYIHSFAQMDDGSIVTSITGFMCLYKAHNDSRTGDYNVTVFAGQCRQEGMQDGDMLKAAKFTKPAVLLVDYHRKILYVADDLVLRAINLVESVVTTYPNHDWYRGGRILSLAFSKNHSNLFIGLNAAVFVKNLDSPLQEFSKLLVGEELAYRYGRFDGKFGKASFHAISSMVHISNETLLVGDQRNNRIRNLNFTSKTVTSVCTGRLGSADGLKESCEIEESLTDMVLFRNSAFFTDGQPGRIRCLIIYGLDGNKSELHELNIRGQSEIIEEVEFDNSTSSGVHLHPTIDANFTIFYCFLFLLPGVHTIFC